MSADPNMQDAEGTTGVVQMADELRGIGASFADGRAVDADQEFGRYILFKGL